jgi:hypothetical protein
MDTSVERDIKCGIFDSISGRVLLVLCVVSVTLTMYFGASYFGWLARHQGEIVIRFNEDSVDNKFQAEYFAYIINRSSRHQIAFTIKYTSDENGLTKVMQLAPGEEAFCCASWEMPEIVGARVVDN